MYFEAHFALHAIPSARLKQSQRPDCSCWLGWTLSITSNNKQLLNCCLPGNRQTNTSKTRFKSNQVYSPDFNNNVHHIHLWFLQRRLVQHHTTRGKWSAGIENRADLATTYNNVHSLAVAKLIRLLIIAIHFGRTPLGVAPTCTVRNMCIMLIQSVMLPYGVYNVYMYLWTWSTL